nr:peptidoglycan DD-metalloendopeptidase family protein [Pseudomonas duriflava]
MAVVCLTGLLLTGCSSPSSNGVKVYDRSGSTGSYTHRVTSGYYTVRRGDTLFTIANRNGWNWRDLAAHNGIHAPYVIHVGQRIKFGGRTSTATTARSQAPARVPVVTAPGGISTPSTTSPSTPVAPPAVTQTLPPAPPVPTAPPATTPTVTMPQTTAGWAWPTKGTLIARYASNGSLNKGIDIAGDLGQPVLAASNGTVVYAGSGLRGYGELIIIKHNETYVSAYGHNRRLLVREGQQVKVGQTIAEMGSTGTDRVKLHFEIRRQGKPVDPLQYLPNR